MSPATRTVSRPLNGPKTNPSILYFTDIQMLQLNRYERTEKLREKPAYPSTTIMMVSSLDETIDPMRGFEAGADDYLEKPFSEEELRRKADELLNSMVR
jgi:DNA-binding response OmpR family regulator